ncbi:MAG: ABC transporter substrate-binding protein [Deltaproteobacteria bacterium]|nr:ABC transporter substrate-binding protein [Deltaproteobacteria bacterium]
MSGRIGFGTRTSDVAKMNLKPVFCLWLGLLILSCLPFKALGAERFYVSIPGPSLSYAHLFYGQEKGFFAEEGLDLQVLVVRGQVGISSLMSGEIDATCHVGSGFVAALRGLPLKVISVTRDRPSHELIVASSVRSAADLKGKPVAVGSLEGTAAVMTRRILQAKGLDPQKDVIILSTENTAVRYHSLLTGKVAGAMLTPPSTYLALDQGFKLFDRGPRLYALPPNRSGDHGCQDQARPRQACALSPSLESRGETVS